MTFALDGFIVSIPLVAAAAVPPAASAGRSVIFYFELFPSDRNHPEYMPIGMYRSTPFHTLNGRGVNLIRNVMRTLESVRVVFIQSS